MTNGQAVSLKWLVGVLVLALGAGLSLYIDAQADDKKAIQERVMMLEQRATRQEVEMSALHADISYIKGSLLRIEGKLER
jgi:hypothetical protein